MSTAVIALFCLLATAGVWSKPVHLNETFTTSLMKMLADKGGNLVICPVSMEASLGMVGFGAKGTTREEIFMTLGYDPTNAKESMTEKQKLLHDESTTEVTWESANMIMASENFTLWAKYVTEVDQIFLGVPVEPFNFGDGVKTAAHVNSWVSNKTQNVIKKILKPGSVDPDTKLIILNADYFKAQWMNMFDPKNTKSDCFYSEPSQCSLVDMMSNEVSIKYKFHPGLNAEIIELPYKNYKYSMVIILPAKRNGLVSLTQNPKFNVSDIVEFIDADQIPQKVNVKMPKFEVEFDQDVKQTLINMGMETVFSPFADLTAMFTQEGASVNSVIHKAKIICNEYGTHAAAATVVEIVSETLAPPLKFTADHPFMFMIKKDKAGVLFSGIFSGPN